MAESKSIVLITGANSGIGFELAAQLLAKGTYHVLIGARSRLKGEAAVKGLQSRSLPGTCSFLEVDVTDDNSISNAAKTIETDFGRLDCLVNNAAIAPLDPPTRQKMRECFETNVIGVHFLTAALTPWLKKSKTTARVINVSSGIGSITLKMDHSRPVSQQQEVTYRTSKTALNMVTACQTYDFKDDGIVVLSYCPGFTESNLGPHNTTANGAKPVSEGARPLAGMVGGEKDGDVGKFSHAEGTYPW